VPLPGTEAYYLWVGASWQNFRAKWEELAAQNLRLIDLDVVPPGGAQSPLPLESRITAQPADFGGMAEERRLIAQTAAAGYRTSLTSNGPSRSSEEDGFGGGSAQSSGAADDSAAGLGGGEFPRAGVTSVSDAIAFKKKIV
jgi:hypothetical protein